MNRLQSLGRKLLLLSPVPVLFLNLWFLTPPSQSNATLELFQSSQDSDYQVTQEEAENMRVYQLNAPAVVSINSGKNQGAGVIISSDGLVVTNKHVVQGVNVLNVKTANGAIHKAQVITYGSGNRDLAFLKILSKGVFPFARLGNSQKVKVGQRVLAIGSPFGLDGTLTTGIISRIDRSRNMIQTDAAINPGNSGGPLLNTRGELIGINRSIVNPVGASSAGISFAVPIDIVKEEIASNGFETTHLARTYNH